MTAQKVIEAIHQANKRAVKNYGPIRDANTGCVNRTSIKALQIELCDSLPGKTEMEKEIFANTPFQGKKDKADVYADAGDWEIIIEIDTTRADQVAKKMVSRLSYNILANASRQPKKKLIYVALLYPGTTNMSLPECEKYFLFCESIVDMIGNGSKFIGCLIDGNNTVIQKCPAINNAISTPASNIKAIKRSNSSTMSYSVLQGQNKSANLLELLDKDAYEDYLGETLKESSVYQYLRIVSEVHNDLLNDATTDQYIFNFDDKDKLQGAINLVKEHLSSKFDELNECCKKPSVTKTEQNNRAYYRKYRDWYHKNH